MCWRHACHLVAHCSGDHIAGAACMSCPSHQAACEVQAAMHVAAGAPRGGPPDCLAWPRQHDVQRVQDTDLRRGCGMLGLDGSSTVKPPTLSKPGALLMCAHVLQVRRLVAACLVKMYALGDSLPLYSRVSALQQFLTSKEAAPRGSPESVRLGALECLAALCGAHGRLLGASMPDSMAAAVRHAGRWELGGCWLAAVGISKQCRGLHLDVEGCMCAQRCI